MRRLITLLLILPALAVGQSRFGHGGSGGVSVSSLLPIIADSTLWHLQGTDTLVTDGALPIKVPGIRVTGNARLDGNLVMNTVATEQVKLGTGSDAAPELSSVGDPNTGIRFPGSDVTTFVQGGSEKARIDPNGINVGATTTPKAKLQVTATGISAADYYKGIRLSNPDAATVGVQAFSPALVFRGAGWKTDATAGSDSLLAAMFLEPVQGASAPTSLLTMYFKIGSGSWTRRFSLSSGGALSDVSTIAATSFTAIGGGAFYGTRFSAALFGGSVGNVMLDARTGYLAQIGINNSAHITDKAGLIGILTVDPLEELHVKGEVAVEESGAGSKKWRLQTDPTTGKLEFYFRNTTSWIKKASVDTTGAYTDEY